MDEITLWLDPVCPYSWTTARWLRSVADKEGFVPRWELMSLAVLNEGRELPPPQAERMRASRSVGRLFASLARTLDDDGMWSAYAAFGEAFFERGAPFDDRLVGEVLRACAATGSHEQSPSDETLDAAVRASHERGQRALGDSGGSPIVSIGGTAFFGPVLTSLPGQAAGPELFLALKALAAIPEFSQLQRPRPVRH
ncbi:hypothetical protein [Segniliparus rugosus]|uniref:DSBA-like thioredoxin domain-containing protein n=1 Tax=Segniliparus rugosus (strain ATCC BAA-974 / DSM 45345 / CCUG 50838 / CIP 108380 / JCM 13579 / CDC 945) TaxID=679197 RepID=E5XP16_SEGRC|nr:hypothetical protein [Segniliparus rugosus]EFV13908.1 hypothetical protein HMPREF9336_01237 [Segniliparus rugosus ATCC BAA-974]